MNIVFGAISIISFILMITTTPRVYHYHNDTVTFKITDKESKLIYEGFQPPSIYGGTVLISEQKECRKDEK